MKTIKLMTSATIFLSTILVSQGISNVTPYTKKLMQIQSEYCQMKKRLLTNPTSNNLEEYTKIHSFIVEKSKEFANTSQEVLKRDPKLKSNSILDTWEFNYQLAYSTWTKDCPEGQYIEV